MEGSNLLSGGVDELNEIKEYLLELRGNQANIASRTEEEKRLESSINALEKAVADEILSITKKRKTEIEDTFDRQITKIRDRVKKIKERRTRKKNSKVSERINAETSTLRSENTRLALEAKMVMKQREIPSFCNTKLYYALYLPSCFTDYLVILAALTVILLLIPCGIYFLILPEEKIIYMIITYVITVLFFGGAYLITGNLTREKYMPQIQQVKGIRSTIRINKKKISDIKSNIKKDRDESTYGLQSYDEELAKLNKEEDDVLLQKKDALENFENTTKQVIASEIRGMNEEKLSGLKAEYDKVCAEAANTEEKIKALTIKIASEYEPFLGKDLITLERLESLTNILLAGNAANISEAIAFYRQNMLKAPQE